MYMLDRWKDSTDLSLHWRLTGTAPLLGRWALWPDAIVTDSLSLLAGQRFRCALQLVSLIAGPRSWLRNC